MFERPQPLQIHPTWVKIRCYNTHIQVDTNDGWTVIEGIIQYFNLMTFRWCTLQVSHADGSARENFFQADKILRQKRCAQTCN